MTGLTADEAIDRDLLVGELEAGAVRRDRAPRGRLEPARLGLPLGDGLFTLHRPRVRAAGRPARVDRRPPRGRSRRCSTRPGDAGRARRPAGRPVPDRDGAASSSPGSSELIADALARPRRPRPTDPAVAALLPRLGRRRRDRTRRRRRLRDAPARRRPAGERRRRPARGGAVRGEDAPHDALGDAHPGTHPGRCASGSSPRSGRRWSGWRASCGRPGCGDAGRSRTDDGALVRGVLDAIAADHPDGATTCSTSAARRTPGSRRSAASAT